MSSNWRLLKLIYNLGLIFYIPKKIFSVKIEIAILKVEAESSYSLGVKKLFIERKKEWKKERKK